MALPYIIMAAFIGTFYILFLLWTLWGRMAHALQMLQQCHYMNDRFTTWIAGHRLNGVTCPFYLYLLLHIGCYCGKFLMPNPGSILQLALLMIAVYWGFELSNLIVFSQKNQKNR